jgi:hypothetical protein
MRRRLDVVVAALAPELLILLGGVPDDPFDPPGPPVKVSKVASAVTPCSCPNWKLNRPLESVYPSAFR